MAMTGSLNMDSAAQAESGNPGLFPHRHPGETGNSGLLSPLAGVAVAWPSPVWVSLPSVGKEEVETVTPYRGYMGMFSSSGGGG